MIIIGPFESFFKVVILSVGMLESGIVDERHFPDQASARQFAASSAGNDKVAIIIAM